METVASTIPTFPVLHRGCLRLNTVQVMKTTTSFATCPLLQPLPLPLRVIFKVKQVRMDIGVGADDMWLKCACSSTTTWLRLSCSCFPRVF